MNVAGVVNEIIEIIEKEKPRSVLLQLPDGLKPKAKEIVDALREKFSGVEFYIWAGSNYGACDIPRVEVDLVINVGHAELL